MAEFKIQNPNIEWEGIQTCTLNSEELLAIQKTIKESRDYHSSRADSLYRCTIDIRNMLLSGHEGDNTFYVRMLYNLEHAMAFHRLNEGRWQIKLAMIDAQLLYKDGPANVLPWTAPES